MFFLKLEGRDVERLSNLAKEKGMRVERLARLVFLKGVRSLAKADEIAIETIEPSIVRTPYRRKSLEERQAYIREHWQQKTDIEMGRALGYGWVSIQITRREMGLLRQTGRQSMGDLIPEQQQEIEKIDALIREHWKTKDDWKIGRLMEPNVSGNRVRARRYKLGLKAVQGTKRFKAQTETLRDVIEPEEFKRMVLREGYTMTEYLRFKKFRCTSQRLSQVVEEMGLKQADEDRASNWVLIRRARKLGNLNLSNREWLAERVAAATSMTALAAELGVDDANLHFFIRAFEFTHPSFRKYGTETVTLVCTKCGIEFKRLKRWHDRALKLTNGRQLEFFCSQSCTGQWNSERVRKQTEKIERQLTFIRENWQSMSDAQMALTLKLKTKTVVRKRQELGLKRVNSAQLRFPRN